MAKQTVILSQFLRTFDGENQQEGSEDTVTIDKASGCSSSDSRKQGEAGRSFKTAWLSISTFTIYSCKST